MQRYISCIANLIILGLWPVLFIACQQSAPDIRTHGMTTKNALILLKRDKDPQMVLANLEKVRTNFSHDFEWPRFWTELSSESYYDQWTSENIKGLHNLSEVSCNSNEFGEFVNFLLVNTKRDPKKLKDLALFEYISGPKRTCDALIDNKIFSELVSFLLEQRQINQSQTATPPAELIYSQELFRLILGEFDRRDNHTDWIHIFEKIDNAFWVENHVELRKKEDLSPIVKSLQIQHQVFGAIPSLRDDLLALYQEDGNFQTALKKGNYLPYLEKDAALPWSSFWNEIQSKQFKAKNTENEKTLISLYKYSCAPSDINAFAQLARMRNENETVSRLLQSCKASLSPENFENIMKDYLNDNSPEGTVAFMKFLELSHDLDLKDPSQSRDWKSILSKISQSKNLLMTSHLRSSSRPDLLKKFLFLHRDVYGQISFLQEDLAAISNQTEKIDINGLPESYKEVLPLVDWNRFWKKVSSKKALSPKQVSPIARMDNRETKNLIENFTTFPCGEDALNSFVKTANEHKAFETLVKKSQECKQHPITASHLRSVLQKLVAQEQDLTLFTSLIQSENSKPRKDAPSWAELLQLPGQEKWLLHLAKLQRENKAKTSKETLDLIYSTQKNIPFMVPALVQFTSQSENITSDLETFGYNPYLGKVSWSDFIEESSTSAKPLDPPTVFELVSGNECQSQESFQKLMALAFEEKNNKKMLSLSQTCSKHNLAEEQIKALGDQLKATTSVSPESLNFLSVFINEFEKSPDNQSESWKNATQSKAPEEWAALMNQLYDEERASHMKKIFSLHGGLTGDIPFMTDSFVHMMKNTKNLKKDAEKYGFQQRFIGQMDWEQYTSLVRDIELDSNISAQAADLIGDQTCRNPNIFKNLVNQSMSSDTVDWDEIINLSNQCSSLSLTINQMDQLAQFALPDSVNQSLAPQVNRELTDDDFKSLNFTNLLKLSDLLLIEEKKRNIEIRLDDWKAILQSIDKSEWKIVSFGLRYKKENQRLKFMLKLYSAVNGDMDFMTEEFIQTVELSDAFTEYKEAVNWIEFWTAMVEIYPSYPHGGFGNWVSAARQTLQDMIDQLIGVFGFSAVNWSQRGYISKERAQTLLSLYETTSCDEAYDAFFQFALQWEQSKTLQESMEKCGKLPQQELLTDYLLMISSDEHFDIDSLVAMFRDQSHLLDKPMGERLQNSFSNIKSERWLKIIKALREKKAYSSVEKIYDTFLTKGIPFDFFIADMFDIITNESSAKTVLETGRYDKMYGRVSWDKLWTLFSNSIPNQPSPSQISNENKSALFDLVRTNNFCNSAPAYLDLMLQWEEFDQATVAKDHCRLDWSLTQLSGFIKSTNGVITEDVDPIFQSFVTTYNNKSSSESDKKAVKTALESIGPQEWRSYISNLYEKGNSQQVAPILELYSEVYGSVDFMTKKIIEKIYSTETTNKDLIKQLNDEKLLSIATKWDWNGIWTEIENRAPNTKSNEIGKVFSILGEVCLNDQYNHFLIQLAKMNKFGDIPSPLQANGQREVQKCDNLKIESSTMKAVKDEVRFPTVDEKNYRSIANFLTKNHFFQTEEDQVASISEVPQSKVEMILENLFTENDENLRINFSSVIVKAGVHKGALQPSICAIFASKKPLSQYLKTNSAFLLVPFLQRADWNRCFEKNLDFTGKDERALRHMKVFHYIETMKMAENIYSRLSKELSETKNKRYFEPFRKRH